MIKYTVLALFALVSWTIQAQNTHKPLVAEGKIPSEFITRSSVKYKTDKIRIDGQARSAEKTTRNKFALETNFLLDEMLRSGKVVFNDKISEYLNQVANILVKNGSAKLGKVKVYTLRSSEVNALATNRGEVLVTLGLLAKIENEAQLAFILCHELTHVQEQHSLELYLASSGLGKKASSADVLREGRSSDKLLAKHGYKRELETEADQMGLERFQKTKYSTESLPRVFQILRYADLPFGEKKFDFNLFESGFYKIPSNFKLDTVALIGTNTEEKDDAESTHPNVSKRLASLRSALIKADNTNKLDYLVSKERFLQMQEIARNELPILQINAKKYAQALYSSYLLLDKNPNSFYAKKCLAKSMYYLNKDQGGDDYMPAFSYNTVEGESQQVHYLLNQLPHNGLTILAMRYAWNVLQLSPKDAELKAIVEDLAIVLASHELDLDVFVSADEAMIDSTMTKVKQKTGRIDDEQSRSNKWTELPSMKKIDSYWHYGFADFRYDSAFVKVMKWGAKENTRRTEINEYYKTSAGKSEWRKDQKRRKKHGYHLGIDKIVVINPLYVKIDERKGERDKYDFISSEQGGININEMIKNIAPKTKLDVNILDVNTLKDNQVNQFNDIRFLNEWYSEQVSRYDLTLTVGTQQSIIDSLAKKYGTDYFLWTGVLSVRQRKTVGEVLNPLWGVLLPPFLPGMLFNAIKPEYDMMYYAILYDVKTGRREVMKFDYFDCRDTQATLKSHFYDTFNQIYSRRKR
jgi:beta-barrel assembly-enhancing protease